MPVQFVELRKEDMSDENLHIVNTMLRSLHEEVNRLGGAYGTIELSADIDMKGGRITNLGSSKSATDAVSTSVADTAYGPAAVKTALAASSRNTLQSVRQLNNPYQRENFSTFLNNLGEIVPNANTSTVTPVDNGDGTSTITITAGYAPVADGSKIPYPQRSDTVANPAAGVTVFYYYSLDVKVGKLKMSGPFPADTDQNRMIARTDGRILVAAVKVATPAGGGSTTYSGTGGGGGTGGTGGGGRITMQL